MNGMRFFVAVQQIKCNAAVMSPHVPTKTREIQQDFETGVYFFGSNIPVRIEMNTAGNAPLPPLMRKA